MSVHTFYQPFYFQESTIASAMPPHTPGDLAVRPMRNRSHSVEMHAQLFKLTVADFDDAPAPRESRTPRTECDQPEPAPVLFAHPCRAKHTKARSADAESTEALIARSHIETRLANASGVSKRTHKKDKLSSPMPRRGSLVNTSLGSSTSWPLRSGSSRFAYAAGGRTDLDEDACSQLARAPSTRQRRSSLRGPKPV